MNINLHEGINEHDSKCPNCVIDLEIKGLPRWNTETTCPNCNAKLLIEFDFYVIGDDEDEADTYEVKIN